MKKVRGILNKSMPYSSMFRVKTPLYITATLGMLTMFREDYIEI